MSYLEVLGLFLTSTGALASAFGLLFAYYARRNGKEARNIIKSENQTMREFLAEVISTQNKGMGEFIAEENKSVREFLAQVIANQTKEMQKFTAEVIAKLDERADGRHREIIETLKR